MCPRTPSALADGTDGYDGVVHDMRVVLANMHHLVSSLREPQAVDTLAACFQAQADAARVASERLRVASDDAEQAGREARATLEALGVSLAGADGDAVMT